MVGYDPAEIGITPEMISAVRGDEVHMACPFHHDSNPSAQFNVVKGLFYCFSCHTAQTADGLALALGGRAKRAAGFDVPKVIMRDRGSGEDLHNFGGWLGAFGVPYFQNRVLGSTDRVASAYGVRWNGSDTLAFPFHDGANKLTGWQTRDIRSKKYRFWGQRQPLWGELGMGRMFWGTEPVYLTEGVFGVLRAASAGVRALSICGSGNTGGIKIAACGPHDVLAFFDDDLAGWKASAVALSFGMRVAIIRGAAPDDLSDGDWAEVRGHTSKYFTGSWLKFLGGIPRGHRDAVRSAFGPGA